MQLRIVRGTGTGPTAVSSYDAALVDANVHDYNVVSVSSVVPAEASVEAVGTAPDLGPAGNRLTAVEARATAAGPDGVAAGLAWATGEGAGLVYEAHGEAAATVRTELQEGIAAGCDLRDRSFDDPEFLTATAEADPGTYATAVVLAAYGESEPI